MSSPIAVNRPASPAESSHSSASGSSYTSTSSMSSSSSTTHGLTYTREELLALGASPLAQTTPPPNLQANLQAFPQIMRRTRRGVLEAYQTLEYSRITSPPATTATVNAPNSPRKPNLNDFRLPVLQTDVYIPPARRTQTPMEQRMRAIRDMKTRAPRRAGPTQARW